MKKENIKYFLYSRKSSESEDRQIQSIDDQVNKLKELAELKNLEIVDILEESHSAKTPGARPVFNEMLVRIENGEANGILCWQTNRLARNPVDGARVQWLLQQGIIKSIQTIDGERRPEDNAVLFSVEMGVSNQYIIDLSKNIKRGLYSKLEKGWLPCHAPIGYLNKRDGEVSTIIKDPNTFTLVRKMWDLMLTGNYSPAKIAEVANNEWGFKTTRRKKIGGKPISLSGLYKMFNNQFYFGVIEYGGNIYQGKHTPMISMDEYDRVQLLLGNKGNKRPQKKDFAYTGIIKCGECGGSITAEDHKKIIKSTSEVKNFVYYKCTKKKKYKKCNQKGMTSLDLLEDQIIKELDKYEIMPEFLDLALDIINQNKEQEKSKENQINQNRIKEREKYEQDKSNLIQMRCRNLIDDTEFKAQKEVLDRKFDFLKDRPGIEPLTQEKTLELTQKSFIFAVYAKNWFINGNNNDKRIIFSALGSNYTLKDKKLFINPNKWLIKVKNSYLSIKEELDRLELTKQPLNKGQNTKIEAVISQWWRCRESNPGAYSNGIRVYKR